MNKSNTHVINLDKDAIRLENMKSLLDNNFTRFSAIYGKDLSEDDINKELTYVGKNFLCNYSMIGCALSHQNLWKKLVNDDQNDFYIIFEDDLKYIDKKLLNKLINRLNELDYDYINLYCELCGFYDSKLEIDELKVGKSVLPLTAAGYIVSKRGAKTLLKYLENNLSYHIDLSVAIIQYLDVDFKILRVLPNLVNPSVETSNLNGKIHSPVFFVFNQLGLTQITWLLAVSTIAINLKFIVPLYFFILLILAIIFKNNKYILMILYIEMICCICGILFY